MTKKNVVKLTATGLRTLIREEASRVRRRRGLAEESKYPAQPWLTEEIEEAIDVLTGACLDAIFDEDDLEGHDNAHPEVHNDILACVEKIFSEYGDPDAGDQGLEDQSAVDRGQY